MKTFKNSQSFVISILVLGLLSYHCCNAETTSCDGTITRAIIGDVECANDCVLYEATVTGNVTCTTGSLVAKGDSTIAGNVFVSGAVRRIVLDDVTVLGDVEVINATCLTKLVIKKAATVNGSVSVQNTPGNIYVSGSIANLILVNSGNLFAHRLTTTNVLGADHGISVLGGNGVVQISGSRVGGGLSVQQHDGDIKIYGTIFIRGTNPDFTVVDHTGDVKLVRAQVSDVDVMKVQGYVVLYSVHIDSNVNIDEVTGNLLLKKLIIIADHTRITNINGNVAIKDSNFNVVNEVDIVSVTGNVAVEDSNFNFRDLVINIAGNVAVKDSEFIASNDWLIRNITGNVEVKDSNFHVEDDLAIFIVNGNVAVKDSNFTVVTSDMQILSINGCVLVKDNTVLNPFPLQFTFRVRENSGPVKIVDNNLTTVTFNGNTGGVAIGRNTIETLTCSNNVPPPDVSETNTIGSSSGQC